MRNIITILEMIDQNPSVLYQYAKQYEDQYEPSHDASGPANKYSWSFDPEYDLTKLCGGIEKFRDFMEEEIQIWKDDGDETRFDDMLTQPIQHPIVIVEINGEGFVWDGNHRIGACALTNRNTIPAVVGVKIMNEEFDDQTILQYVKFHDELNPALWDENDQLKPLIREKILTIASEFYDFLDVDGLVVKDIIFTGSNAAFNYTTVSDVDTHLIVDMKAMNDALAENFFNTKKTLWNNIHDIQIEGYDVELYVEDVDNPVNAAGVYSVLKNEWIRKPIKSKPQMDDISLVAKTNQYVDMIDDLLAGQPSKDELSKVIHDLYVMRQGGLEAGGEFSIENMVFKTVRALGYLQKLRDALLKAVDRSLSLRKR